MKTLIYIILLIPYLCQAQTIKDERALTYVYGQGNNNLSLIFEGAWNNDLSGNYLGVYNYQILPTSENVVKDIDSSTFYGQIKIHRFFDLPEWNCIRDQLLINQEHVKTLELAYHATTNKYRTDITNYIRDLGVGTAYKSIGKEKYYGYIVPGTFRITAGALVVTDNGSGQLIGNVGAGVNTINYGYTNHASINLTFSSTVLKSTPINTTFTLRYFPYQTHFGFVTFRDLPAGTYTFLFFDNAYTKGDNATVTADIKTKLPDEVNFQYTDLLINIP
jgi:hypothetical protein